MFQRAMNNYRCKIEQYKKLVVSNIFDIAIRSLCHRSQKIWQLELEISFLISLTSRSIHRTVIIFGEIDHHDKLAIFG